MTEKIHSERFATERFATLDILRGLVVAIMIIVCADYCRNRNFFIGNDFESFTDELEKIFKAASVAWKKSAVFFLL